MNEPDLAAGVGVLGSRGFEVELAPHLLRRMGYLAGLDEERLGDLQSALDDPQVDVVWFARGGFGTTRLLPHLSRGGLERRPKVLAGYSDATALFAWAQKIPGVRCIYAPSVQELAREGVCDLDSVWRALEAHPAGVPGQGGSAPAGPYPVTGGCLSLLSVLAGTPHAPDLCGRWLFLEDVGERLYRIDRMLTHLAQAGWFERAAGCLLGGFRGLGEEEAPADVASRVLELLGPGKPLVLGLPVGHLKGKHALPFETPALWDGCRLVFP